MALRFYISPIRFSAIVLLFSILIITCKRDDQLDHPMVFTGEVTGITPNGVVFHGRVVEQGSTIIDHGFVWDVNSNPTIAISYKKSLGTVGTEIFSSDITAALMDGKQYFVRSYAQTSQQVIYGMQVQFMSLGGKAPVIHSFEPVQGTWGDTLTIHGINFSTKKDENKLTAGNSTLQVFYASDSIVKGVIPMDLDSISAKISLSVLGNIAYAENPFVLLPPVINSFTPNEGTPAGMVQIYGKNFHPEKTIVSFGTKPAQIDSITNDHIKITTPAGNPEGPLQVSVKVLTQTATSQETYFYKPPVIAAVIPMIATWRDEIKISGRNFLNSNSEIIVRFNDIKAIVLRSYADSLIVRVPDEILVSTSQISADLRNEKFVFQNVFSLINPRITSFTPQTASYGDEIEIQGTNFHPISSHNRVYFGNTLAKVLSSTPESIKVQIPGNIDKAVAPIGVRITELPIIESENSFLLKMHTIEGLEPAFGGMHDLITIKGNDFNPIRERNIVYIGDQQAKIEFSNKNTIQVKLPFLPITGEYPVNVKILDREVTSPTKLKFYQPWTQLKDLPFNMVNGYTFKLNERYFLGGANNSLYEYFPDTDTWIARRSRPSSPADGWSLGDVGWTLFTTATKAYIISWDELFQYDPELDRWTKMIPFVQPPLNREWGYRSFTVNETGYVIGDRTHLIWNGEWAKGRQVWRYAEDENRWKVAATIPTEGLTEGITFTIGGKAYVGFGYDESKIWEYDPEMNLWTEKLDVSQEIGFRTSSNVFVLNDIAYLFSGMSESGVSNEMFTYNPQTNEFKKSANIFSARYGAFSFSLPDGRAIIGGGSGAGNFRDVFLFDPDNLAPNHQP